MQKMLAGMAVVFVVCCLPLVSGMMCEYTELSFLQKKELQQAVTDCRINEAKESLRNINGGMKRTQLIQAITRAINDVSFSVHEFKRHVFLDSFVKEKLNIEIVSFVFSLNNKFKEVEKSFKALNSDDQECLNEMRSTVWRSQ